VTASSADLTPLLLVLAVAALFVVRARRRPSWPVKLAMAVGAGLWLTLLGGAMWMVGQATAAQLPAPPVATTPGNPCTAGQTPKTFNASLINIPIFLNRFGDVVPEGRMYVLDEKIATVRAGFAQAANPAKAAEMDLIEPLTLRVNVGDCAEVRFTNRLNEAAPSFSRNASIFTLPGETLRAPGALTPAPYQAITTLPMTGEYDIMIEVKQPMAATAHKRIKVETVAAS
jgi:hypothetical protein